MKAINELGELQVGERYEFMYSSSDDRESEPSSENLKVKIKDELIETYIQGIASSYPEKTKKMVSIEENLRSTWDMRKQYQERIEAVSLLKKDKMIRLWEAFATEYPHEMERKKDAEGKLKEIKQSLEQEHQKAHSTVNESKHGPDFSRFFRSYSIKEIDAAKAYPVVAWYCGERLDIKTGKRYPLWFSQTGYVAEENFDPSLFVKV